MSYLRNDGEESYAAAGYDAFFDCRASSRQSVFYSQLLFFHLDLGSCADVYNSHAACEFCKTLLQFFFIVFGRSLCNLRFDRAYSCRDSHFVAVASDKGSVVLVDLDLFSSAQKRKVNVFEFIADFAGNKRAACEYRDVLKHCFSSVAKAGSLDSNAVEDTFELVEYDGRQSVAVHIFADYQKFKSVLYDLFKYRHDVLA